MSRTLYFVNGGTNNLFSNPQNWSLTNGGTGGETKPTSIDDVVVVYGKELVLDENIIIRNMYIGSRAEDPPGYFMGGKVTGGNYNITIYSNLVLAGDNVGVVPQLTIISCSGTVRVDGDFYVRGNGGFYITTFEAGRSIDMNEGAGSGDFNNIIIANYGAGSMKFYGQFLYFTGQITAIGEPISGTPPTLSFNGIRYGTPDSGSKYLTYSGTNQTPIVGALYMAASVSAGDYEVLRFNVRNAGGILNLNTPVALLDSGVYQVNITANEDVVINQMNVIEATTIGIADNGNNVTFNTQGYGISGVYYSGGYDILRHTRIYDNNKKLTIDASGVSGRTSTILAGSIDVKSIIQGNSIIDMYDFKNDTYTTTYTPVLKCNTFTKGTGQVKIASCALNDLSLPGNGGNLLIKNDGSEYVNIKAGAQFSQVTVSGLVKLNGDFQCDNVTATGEIKAMIGLNLTCNYADIQLSASITGSNIWWKIGSTVAPTATNFSNKILYKVEVMSGSGSIDFSSAFTTVDEFKVNPGQMVTLSDLTNQYAFGSINAIGNDAHRIYLSGSGGVAKLRMPNSLATTEFVNVTNVDASYGYTITDIQGVGVGNTTNWIFTSMDQLVVIVRSYREFNNSFRLFVANLTKGESLQEIVNFIVNEETPDFDYKKKYIIIVTVEDLVYGDNEIGLKIIGEDGISREATKIISNPEPIPVVPTIMPQSVVYVPISPQTNHERNVQLDWTYVTGFDRASIFLGNSGEPKKLTDKVTIDQTASTYLLGVLTPGETYSWKVNLHNDPLNQIIEGSTQWFRIAQAPGIPSEPSPINNTIDINPNVTLSWVVSNPEGNVLDHDLYFGATTSPVLITTVTTAVTTPSYTLPSSLSSNKTYYWKIVAKDVIKGNTVIGPQWKFRTQA